MNIYTVFSVDTRSTKDTMSIKEMRHLFQFVRSLHFFKLALFVGPFGSFFVKLTRDFTQNEQLTTLTSTYLLLFTAVEEKISHFQVERSRLVVITFLASVLLKVLSSLRKKCYFFFFFCEKKEEKSKLCQRTKISFLIMFFLVSPKTK